MGKRSSEEPRRANGTGSVYPEGQRWAAALTWRDDDGRRRRRVVRAATRDEADRALTRLRDDLDRGLAPATIASTGAYLAGWLERERQRVRPSTWRQRESYVRLYMAPAFGKVPLARLTPAHVERLTSQMVADGHAPTAGAHVRVILRRALGDAQRDGLVHRNVAALARPPHVPTRSLQAGRDYLDAASLRKLLDTVALHPLGPLVTVAATTGLRQGELLGLAWADLDTEAGTLTVRRALARGWTGFELAEPKTARSRRTIHLPSRAISGLARRRERQAGDRATAGSAWQDRDGLVFTDALGRPLKGHEVTHAFHGLLEAAGLPSIPFHGLRHSAATAMLEAGVPLKTVSETLGHSTIAITADVYAHVTPSMRRDAADAMDRAVGGAS